MTKKPAAEKVVSAVKKPRAVRPSATPRVSSARHTKAAVSSEVTEAPAVASAVSTPVATVAEIPTVTEVPHQNAHDVISKIAYGYWEARGYQGGNAAEDWCRAETEFHKRQAAL